MVPSSRPSSAVAHLREGRHRPMPGSGPPCHGSHRHYLVSSSARRNMPLPALRRCRAGARERRCRCRRSVRNPTVECSGGDQFSMIDGSPPSATPARPSLAENCCPIKSSSIAGHTRPPAAREVLPRRLSDAGPHCWRDRSRRAGIRNPSRQRSLIGRCAIAHLPDAQKAKTPDFPWLYAPAQRPGTSAHVGSVRKCFV